MANMAEKLRSRPDYSLLLRRIYAEGETQRSISKCIGLSESHFSRKLAGLYDFTQHDIRLLCRVLDIGQEDIGRYFFGQRVEESQHTAQRAEDAPRAGRRGRQGAAAHEERPAGQDL